MSEPAARPPSPVPPEPRASDGPLPGPSSTTRLPPRIPDHELLHPIGRGAYGEVWLARNVVGTLRAVKVVYRQDFGDPQPFDREFKGIQKFEPVSRSHDGLVDILQIGRDEAEGYFYYVMELADEVNAERGIRNAEQTVTRPTGALSHPTGEGRGEGQAASRSEPRAPCSRELVPHSALPAPRSEEAVPRSALPVPSSYAPYTLRHDLKSRGRLPVEECLHLGLALTSALDHLHKNGLVHRDIKPSNLIFVNGQPKLADIGLVAAIDDAHSMVGTAGYIAPEGPGSPQADLYSLGKVLYEAAFGKDRQEFPQLPVDLQDQADHPRLLELNAVILKACESDPRLRYRSADDLGADLARLQRGQSVRNRRTLERAMRLAKRTLPVAALLVVLGVAFVNLSLKNSRQGSLPAEKASVFVLPFRNDGTNAVPDDLHGRITDAFIDSLALIDGLRRSPRKSGWRWLDEDEIRHALAKTNNMRHVLTGRIASSNDGLALTLRLYPRGSDQPLWTESFSGKTNELLALEHRALHELSIRLGLKISPSEQQRISTLLTNNLEALRWYQQANAVYVQKGGTHNGFTEVRKLAQKAMNMEARYLDADFYDAYMLRKFAQDRAPSDVWLDLRRRMASILDQDDTYAEALGQMGIYALCYQRDWDTCYALTRLADAYRPKQYSLYSRAVWYRIYGWFDEARVCQEQAEHPEPTHIDQRAAMAHTRWADRRYAEGAQMARRTLELYPGHAGGYLWLAHCLVANGDYAEGIEATHKAQEVWKIQEMTALRAFAYAKMGQPEKAREVLQELLEVQRTGPYLQPYFVARVYAALNDKEKALEWLEKTDQDRSQYLFVAGGGLRTDPAWDDLKEEPRFKALLKKLGFDQWPRPKPKDWSL